MDNLLKEIRRVQRRLAFEHFLGILGWCWFAALLAGAIAVAAARIWPLASMTGIRDGQWIVGSLVAGLVAAIAWTLLTLTPAIRAALEIDRRCGLKERVSSTLAMNVLDRQSEAGQALIADADARLRRTAVLEQFPVRPSRNLLLPLVPAAIVLAAMFFWSPAVKKLDAAVDAEADQTPPVEVKRSIDDLQQKLALLRKKEDKKAGLKDATDLLKEIEEGANDTKLQSREKALVKLNDLARQLQERRKLLGSTSPRQQLEPVQGIAHGPVEKLAKALAKSDFQKAAHELEELKKQLDGNGLDDAKKNELAQQFEQIKQKLDQLAQQQKQAEADLKKQAEQVQQAGDANAAQKLEDQIQKLEEQGPQMKGLNNLADKLGQCAGQMKQSQGEQAAQSMQEALDQVQKLARQQGEIKTLDKALQMIADARRQMNCEKCGGKGCKECQGQGEGTMAETGNGESESESDKDGQPGSGIGTQRGHNRRPEAQVDAHFYDSHVGQNVGKGAAQVTGLTDGPNLKNQAESEIQQATAAVEHGSADPLSGQRLPKKQSEHVREYFDSFREGK